MKTRRSWQFTTPYLHTTRRMFLLRAAGHSTWRTCTLRHRRDSRYSSRKVRIIQLVFTIYIKAVVLTHIVLTYCHEMVSLHNNQYRLRFVGGCFLYEGYQVETIVSQPCTITYYIYIWSFNNIVPIHLVYTENKNGLNFPDDESMAVSASELCRSIFLHLLHTYKAI